MIRRRVLASLVPMVVAGLVTGAAGDEAAPPSNYVGALAGTTLAYRPPGGPADGPQGDLSLALGVGRQLRPDLGVELDVGPVFVEGELVALAVVPGVIYGFRPNLYAALRVLVLPPLLDNDRWNLGLAPGIGGYWPAVVTPTLELNAVSLVGQGDPDVGLSITAGALYFF